MTDAPFPLQSLLPIFAYFTAGLFLRRRGLATAEHADFVFRLVFLLTLPAMVFRSVSTAELGAETALLPVSGFLVNLVGAATAALVGKWRGYPAHDIGAMVISAGIINMGFTFPFIAATLGDTALANAFLFDVGNAMFVAFCVYPLAEYFGHHSTGFSFASMKRVLLSPMFISVVAALLVNLLDIRVGQTIDAVLAPLGAATIPLMLIGVGMSFSGLDEKLPPALFAIGIRIVGGALVGLCAVWVFDFRGLTAVVVITSAAAPVGASAAAIASVSGLNRSVAINAVSLSALIGLFTTSALLYLTSSIFG